MRKCSKCGVRKSLEDYYNYKNGKDGRQHYCKECQKAITAEKNGGYKLKKMKQTDTHKQCRKCEEMVLRENMRETYCVPCVSEMGRQRNIKKYGLTIEDYDALFDKQKGLCGCCGKPDKTKLCVDHDHVSGVVRGLLCRLCNRAIGQLGDNVEGVTNALRYLNNR